MSKCLGCGMEKEFEKDRFCQTCEGKHQGKLTADNVRYEVLFMAKKYNLSPESRRMTDYKERSLARWKKQALFLIDTETFQTFYQSFMRTLATLTEHITPSFKTNEVPPVNYQD